jgi:hypothetical protein
MIAELLADLWKLSASDVVRLASENFRRLLSFAETDRRSEELKGAN